MPENDTQPQNNEKRKLSLGVIALIIQGAEAGLILLTLFSITYLGNVGWVLAFFLALVIFALPIIGIIMGIIALCVKDNRSVKNNVCAAVAIIMPILVVGILIILMSARVIVISLM